MSTELAQVHTNERKLRNYLNLSEPLTDNNLNVNLYLLCNNWYFMTNPIHMNDRKPATCDYFLLTSMVCKYLLTMMPGDKRFNIWCKDDMVRAITVMRDGVPTLKAVESCNIPITTLRRHGKIYSIAIL